MKIEGEVRESRFAPPPPPMWPHGTRTRGSPEPTVECLQAHTPSLPLLPQTFHSSTPPPRPPRHASCAANGEPLALVALFAAQGLLSAPALGSASRPGRPSFVSGFSHSSSFLPIATLCKRRVEGEGDTIEEDYKVDQRVEGLAENDMDRPCADGLVRREHPARLVFDLHAMLAFVATRRLLLFLERAERAERAEGG